MTETWDEMWARPFDYRALDKKPPGPEQTLKSKRHTPISPLTATSVPARSADDGDPDPRIKSGEPCPAMS
jgi:hypothetical protein